MSILIKALQQILWAPLQPVLVSLSQAVSYVEQAAGQFSNDFNFDFNRLNFDEFSTAFNNDFTTVVHKDDFSNAFSTDFAQA